VRPETEHGKGGAAKALGWLVAGSEARAAEIAGAGAWLCRGLRTGSYDATCGGDDDLRSSSSSRSKLIFDGSR